MEDYMFNDKICVILFNKLISSVILNYINKDKIKFKNIVNNKLSLLTNKYNYFLLNSKNPLRPIVPGDNNNITYIKKYINYLNIIINNNYEIPENEMNIIITILNESIYIFLEKLKIKTIKFNEKLTFYKNQYKNNCWINHFIQILGCQPVFTKHFEKYVKNAYINYFDNTKEKLNLEKLNITLPEYNYIFNKIPLYTYEVLQTILENNCSSVIKIINYTYLPEDIEINIIEPYYILPVYNNRKYYKFNNSGYCINDDNFIRLYNISNVLLNGKFYFVRKTKNNLKYIILLEDFKKHKFLIDVITIYVCFVYNDYYYLIENNESLSYYSIIANIQKDSTNKNNIININNISDIYYDDNKFNDRKYTYCLVNNYINTTSIYTPYNGSNISHLFTSLSSIINNYYKKDNDILYIISYNIIKIFKETIYNKKINTLIEPLFYAIDLLNNYSDFNIPICQSPDPVSINKLNKSNSLNNLNKDIQKLNIHNKSHSYNNIININSVNNNLNTIHNFLLDSKFYNLFNN